MMMKVIRSGLDSSLRLPSSSELDGDKPVVKRSNSFTDVRLASSSFTQNDSPPDWLLDGGASSDDSSIISDDCNGWDNEEEDIEASNMSFSENSSRSILVNNAGTRSGVGGGKESVSDTRRRSSFHNLSFDEAKKIWCREFTLNMRIDDDHNIYSASKFGDDLDKSLRDNEHNHSRINHLQDEENKSEEEEGRKSVRFNDVTIQEYPIIPGQHPGGHSGVPLTIAWEHYDPVTIDLTAYEKFREPHRRCMAQMRIPNAVRNAVLRNLGFTTRELQEASKAATIVRRQRIRSNEVNLDTTLEHIEIASRAIRNALSLGKKKRKERAFLSRHVPSYHRRKSDAKQRRGCNIKTSSCHTEASSCHGRIETSC